jgi:hypothetical protein
MGDRSRLKLIRVLTPPGVSAIRNVVTSIRPIFACTFAARNNRANRQEIREWQSVLSG